MTGTKSRPNLIVSACAIALALSVSSAGSAQTCGNGVIEVGEECDDGLGFRLDGCAPDCTYEHVQQMTQIELAGGTAPAACTPATNAFGNAFTSTARSLINGELAAGIADGSIDQLLQVLDLDDPGAVNDPAIEVGVLSGTPDLRGGGTGLDSWHAALPGYLEPDGLPAARLAGSVSASELTAGPDRIELDFLGGSVTVRDSLVTAVVAPPTSLPSPPPDALQTGFGAFETLLAADGLHGLCGNITVGTLAALPLPQEFTTSSSSGCSAACAGSREYTWCGSGNPVGPGCNSMLDLLVSGCAVAPPVCIALVAPQQPDVGTGGAPPGVLVPDPTTGKVTVTEPEDAYSTWLEFASQRVHMTNNVGAIFIDGFESSGTGAWSATQP